MPLERCLYTGSEDRRYPPGSVLFDITLPPNYVRCYHGMIIRLPPIQRQADETDVPISDMTCDGIQWPVKNVMHRLHDKCFVGVYQDESGEVARQVLEALRSLRTDPTATGEREVYVLASHGIRQPDPNDPSRDMPGIRCSCASLIEYCYEEAGADLVDRDQVPELTLEDLRVLLVTDARISRELLRRQLREWGLKGDEPWKVLLPAYQMRAFEKPRSLLPYAPTAKDHPYSV
jgi:hypothetical protein